jgi:nitrate reductase NapE component
LTPRARQRLSRPTPERPQVFSERRRDEMSVVVFIVLTVAIFALLGLVQKMVERL